jgi:hypothetical protein
MCHRQCNDGSERGAQDATGRTLIDHRHPTRASFGQLFALKRALIGEGAPHMNDA